MYSEILYEYEMILLNKKTTFSSFFFSENAERNEKKALYVFRFAIENYLRWTPEQTKSCINYAIIDELKLNSLLKYIRFPPELDERDNMFVLVGKIYPNVVQLNPKEITLKVYKRVLEKDLYKFPKEYLSGDQKGRNRAIVCFQYMLSQFTNFKNTKEMYCYFSTANGPKLLKKYRLNVACVSLFVYPIDFLHSALPKNQKDEFWYRYYKFKISNTEQIRALKKAGKYEI